MPSLQGESVAYRVGDAMLQKAGQIKKMISLGWKDRAIAINLGVDVSTVKRCRMIFTEIGLTYNKETGQITVHH